MTQVDTNGTDYKRVQYLVEQGELRGILKQLAKEKGNQKQPKAKQKPNCQVVNATELEDEFIMTYEYLDPKTNPIGQAVLFEGDWWHHVFKDLQGNITAIDIPTQAGEVLPADMATARKDTDTADVYDSQDDFWTTGKVIGLALVTVIVMVLLFLMWGAS